MYSRQTNRPSPPFRLPENYSGCAFSEEKPADVPTRFLEVAKPTHEDLPPIAPHKDLPPSTKESPPPLLPIKIDNLPFLKGMEFDQLLILGLIVLLSRGEEGGEVLPWLLLLLICG